MSEPKKPFEYFDSPDGEDVLPKLWLLLKPASIVAFAVSTVDVFLYSHPKGYLQTLGRYLHCSWPILTATSLFVLTHNFAASVRHKDDKANWFMAGAAAGSVYGLWKRSPRTVVSFGFVGGLAGVGKKYSVQNGIPLFPEPITQIGGLRSVNQDWTLTRHIPGNWTTGQK